MKIPRPRGPVSPHALLLPVGLAAAVWLASCDPAPPEPLMPVEASPSLGKVADGPEVLLSGGTVLTVHPMSRIDEAILLRGPRIAATGTSKSLRRRAAPDAVEIDLGGRTVMPGFVDPHNHIFNKVFLGDHPEFPTYASAQQSALSLGTTTLGNPGVWPAALADFLSFVENGELRIRTSLYLGFNDACGGEWPTDWYLAHPPITDPQAMLRIPGIKLFTDGGSCRRGAFSFLPGGGDLYLSAEQIAATIRRMESFGYQMAIHALGDRAVEATLDAFDLVKGQRPNRSRHRMEHNLFVHPDDRRRYGKLDVVPVMFGTASTCSVVTPGSFWHGLTKPHNAHFREYFDPIRALVEDNPEIRVTWKSDAPRFFPLSPLDNLWSLVTRDRMHPRLGTVCEAPDFLAATGLDVEDAMEIMTINAAYALGMEDAVGSLRRGKLADLIVLSQNPLETPPDDLRRIEVLMTMVGGRVEHCAPGAEALCPGS